MYIKQNFDAHEMSQCLTGDQAEKSIKEHLKWVLRVFNLLLDNSAYSLMGSLKNKTVKNLQRPLYCCLAWRLFEMQNKSADQIEKEVEDFRATKYPKEVQDSETEIAFLKFKAGIGNFTLVKGNATKGQDSVPGTGYFSLKKGNNANGQYGSQTNRRGNTEEDDFVNLMLYTADQLRVNLASYVHVSKSIPKDKDENVFFRFIQNGVREFIHHSEWNQEWNQNTISEDQITLDGLKKLLNRQSVNEGYRVKHMRVSDFV